MPRIVAAPAPSQGTDPFSTTRWSRIAGAGSSDPQVAAKALEDLVGQYEKPIRAYIGAMLRKRGISRDMVDDLTQEVFMAILDRGFLRQADPSRGRFRAFLVNALVHLVDDHCRRAGRQKRGGGRPHEPMDDWTDRLPNHLGPEELFLRLWRLRILRGSVEQLEAEFRENGKGALFEPVMEFLEPERKCEREISLDDLVEPSLLIDRVNRRERPVDGWLGEWLSSRGVDGSKALSESDRNAATFRAEILGALNDLVRGESIYDAARFDGIELDSETRGWLEKAQQPEGPPSSTARLNRRLLEDAYPGVFAKGGKRKATSDRLGMTPQAFDKLISRTRARLQEIVRSHVRETVSSSEDFGTEWRALFS